MHECIRWYLKFCTNPEICGTRLLCPYPNEHKCFRILFSGEITIFGFGQLFLGCNSQFEPWSRSILFRKSLVFIPLLTKSAGLSPEHIYFRFNCLLILNFVLCSWQTPSTRYEILNLTQCCFESEQSIISASWMPKASQLWLFVRLMFVLILYQLKSTDFSGKRNCNKHHPMQRYKGDVPSFRLHAYMLCTNKRDNYMLIFKFHHCDSVRLSVCNHYIAAKNHQCNLLGVLVLIYFLMKGQKFYHCMPYANFNAWYDFWVSIMTVLMVHLWQHSLL